MNKEDKNLNQVSTGGKKSLYITTIVVIALSLVALVCGIVLFVNGFRVSGVGSKIWRIILGVVLVAVGMIFGYASIMAFISSISMFTNKTETSKESADTKPTINIVKCEKCGHDNPINAEVCSNCGESLLGFVECECGTRNPKGSDSCINCGKKLNK